MISTNVPMLISLLKDKDTPIEECKGLETIDLTLYFVLVKASVEPVAQAFSTLKQMDVWVPNAYNREILVYKESILIFQFRGHSWSIIYHPYGSGKQSELKEEDARSLSESLNTDAFFYFGSDSSGIIKYHFFRNGVSQEKMFFEEPDDTLEFQSQLCQTEAGEIEDGYTQAMNFVHEQDAYIPGLIAVEPLRPNQTTTLRIENLSSAELERMDYLAQQ